MRNNLKLFLSAKDINSWNVPESMKMSIIIGCFLVSIFWKQRNIYCPLSGQGVKGKEIKMHPAISYSNVQEEKKEKESSEQIQSNFQNQNH